MSFEQYKPKPEEMKKVEETMTDEQQRLSMQRKNDINEGIDLEKDKNEHPEWKNTVPEEFDEEHVDEEVRNLKEKAAALLKRADELIERKAHFNAGREMFKQKDE